MREALKHTCAHPVCDRTAGRRLAVQGIKRWLCGTHAARVWRNGRLTLPRDFETESRWWCNGCRKYRHPSLFATYISRRTEQLLHKNECRPCEAVRMRDWRLKNDFGVPFGWYDKTLRQQKGHCYACPSTERLVVDHDHESGKVRGILCERCNYSLGWASDNIATLTNLAKYLGVHSA